MKRPGCAMACACLLLSLLAGSALAESAWVETPKGALNARRNANSK